MLKFSAQKPQKNAAAKDAENALNNQFLRLKSLAPELYKIGFTGGRHTLFKIRSRLMSGYLKSF